MKKKKEILISESLLFAAVVESFFAFDSRFDTKLFSNLMKFGFHSCPQIGPNSNYIAHAKFNLGRLFGLIVTPKKVILKYFIDGPFSKSNFFQEFKSLKMPI